MDKAFMSIHHFDTIINLSEAVARDIVNLAHEQVDKKGFFTIVFTGGKTPAFLYELLGSSPFVEQIPWQQTHIFWGDERCVPPHGPQSNYKLAFDALLAKGIVPDGNIHRMEGEIESPAEGARRYQQEIELFFKSVGGQADCPGFDLILLGMGTDGHIASLFPGTSLSGETSSIVLSCDGALGSPAVPRITLSISAINQAKNVFMMISGEKKKKIFEEIDSGQPGVEQKYPAALVRPEGKLFWYIAS
jgi:6-phosphogluconolactonase